MLDPRADDEIIFNHALQSVGKVKGVLSRIGRRAYKPDASEIYAHGLGEFEPVAHRLQDSRQSLALEDSQGITHALNSVAVACQARPLGEKMDLSGRTRRMLDPQWWAKNLRRETVRENETTEHAQGGIRKKQQCYVSDHAVLRKGQRAKKNRETLGRMEVVNGDGEAYNLLEVSDASVSNPKLRRAELMTRCRGFEEVAEFMGHEAVFLTITAPSRFHRFNAQGQKNENWKGETPKDAQKYLNETWAKIRAEWKRCGYAPYGFRVAEPHHDGCPHWHLLLFAPVDTIGWFVPRRLIAGREDHGAGIVGIAGAYALAESSGEPGAVKHRFTVVRIDLTKGSATGYIAKYICKNIDGIQEDGQEMGLDFASGTKAAKGAARVRTWASVWGIRQFQQIGGPSVTVWREARRLREKLEDPQLHLFENIRAAADRASWMAFWMLQGGPEAGRAGLCRPKWAADSQGKYGDEVKRVIGIRDADDVESIVTRMSTWTVQRAGLAAVDAFTAANERRFKAFGTRDPDFLRDFSPQGEAAQPWTGVNNCTDDDLEALRLDAMRGPGGDEFRGWEGKPQPESTSNASQRPRESYQS